MNKQTIQQMRESKGLSIVELSALTGITVKRLEKIEAGKGRPLLLVELVDIARSTNTPIDSFEL